MASRPPLRIKTLPNLITASRLVLAPLTLFALMMGVDRQGDVVHFWMALALVGLVLAEISDIADGVVARRTGEVSNLGKLLDPLSDSMFRMFVFLGFMAVGWMPVWMVALIFARDLIVAYCRVVSGLYDMVLAARLSGKLKAIMQAIAQIATVVFFLSENLIERNFEWDMPPGYMSYALLLQATVVTVWSGWDYVRHVARALSEVAEKETAVSSNESLDETS